MSTRLPARFPGGDTLIRILPRLVLLALTQLLVGSAALPVSTANSGKRFKIVTRTFTQDDGIRIDPAPASFGPVDPYPSSLTVSGLKKGRIKDVNLTLRQFSQQDPRDVDILLVKRGCGSHDCHSPERHRWR